MKHLPLWMLFVPTLALAVDLEDVVGEWAVDAESCPESRLTFTIDQMHEALMAEDGRWVSLAAAPFSIDGESIVIQPADGLPGGQRLAVVTAERDRLVLRTGDAARAAAIGTDTLTLVRCPAY
ncbi:MAG: hypothetical protein RIB46_09750 [Pseudomonadales bacterium]